MAKLIRICPSCNSRRLKKYDIYEYGGRRKIRYRCENCGRLTIYPFIKLVAERKKKAK
jgi:transposase-like protein